MCGVLCHILPVAWDAPVRGTGFNPARSSPGANVVLRSAPDAPTRGAFFFFFCILSVASDAPVRGTGLTPGRSSPGASAVLHSSPDASIRGVFLSHSLCRSLHCHRPRPRFTFPASCSALRLCVPSPGRSSPCDGRFCCPFPSGPLPDVPLCGGTVHPSRPHICRILFCLRAIRRSLCSSPSLSSIPVSPPDHLGRPLSSPSIIVIVDV